jgi:CBS-domain-containing membrane protein
MLIRNLMTKDVITCDATETLNDAAQRMWERDIGALPVVDERGIAIAMLTDRDIAMAGYTQGRPPREIGVRTAMSPRLLTVGPDDHVDEARAIMSEHGVRRVPVIDHQGRPVGMVTLTDLARHFDGGRTGITAGSIAHTLHRISQPREPASVRRLAVI